MDNLGMIIPMLICIIMSAYFSATETAFNSLNMTKIKIAAEHGDKTAALIIRLLDDYNRLLTTILVGNNIVNIALSSMATVLFIELNPFVMILNSRFCASHTLNAVHSRRIGVIRIC